MNHDDQPSVVALFQVVFDQKVGYTISWRRTTSPDLNLDGIEFKSLPSGLHSVKEDLVYFIHNAEFAGVSAFVQQESDAEHRNANFVAVGALVPLSYGRVGRAWLLVEELRRLARSVVGDAEQRDELDSFWKRRGMKEQNEPAAAGPAPPIGRQDSSPLGTRRKRKWSGAGGAGGLSADDHISPHHPALSVPDLLDDFGPLLFPLYREALLRARVLFLGQPPVQSNCNAVYILSHLASLPPPITSFLQPESDASFKTQPLFSIGIHDIPFLSDFKSESGWIACTTDDILRDKRQLYDVAVQMPPSSVDSKKRWPKITKSDGTAVKATQRDLRRYHLLRDELRRMRLGRQRYQSNSESEQDDSGVDGGGNDDGDHDSEDTTLLRSTHLSSKQYTDDASPETVEPVTWAGMAFTNLMWWASAAEMETWEHEEQSADHELFDELPDIDMMLPNYSNSEEEVDEEHKRLLKAQAIATVLMSYFHKLTFQTLREMAKVVEKANAAATNDAGDAPGDGEVIHVSSEDVRHMGLDAWSEADKDFVTASMALWFGKEAKVVGDGVWLCGVRIC